MKIRRPGVLGTKAKGRPDVESLDELTKRVIDHLQSMDNTSRNVHAVHYRGRDEREVEVALAKAVENAIEAVGKRKVAPVDGFRLTRARYALVNGDKIRMMSVEEAKAIMGFRPDYKLLGTIKEQNHLLGNAVPPPMAASVIRQALGRSA